VSWTLPQWLHAYLFKTHTIRAVLLTFLLTLISKLVGNLNAKLGHKDIFKPSIGTRVYIKLVSVIVLKLRLGSTAARLLGLWVRIPLRAWMSVSCECCEVKVSATSWSLVQRSPTECGVSKKCVIVKPRKMRRPSPPRGCLAIVKKKS
jgi:hypothetical protein